MYQPYDKEAIRASVDFAALVAEDTELFPQGSDGELHGACPFCGEDIPHVGDDRPDRFFLARNKKRGYWEWNCRKCPKPDGREMAGGDVFHYVLTLYPDLGFPQACGFLEDFAAEHGSPVRETVDPEPAAEADWSAYMALEPLDSWSLFYVSEILAACQYLHVTRAIPEALSAASDVGWTIKKRENETYVAFPFQDRDGQVVAHVLRAVNPDVADKLKHRTIGHKGLGIFVARATNPLDTAWAVVEAPIDALSLAVAGRNTVALGGTTAGPAWLGDWLKEQGARFVWLAQDNDGDGGAGDKGVDRAVGPLVNAGLTVARLKPPLKDWNAVLVEQGVAAIQDILAGREPQPGVSRPHTVEEPVQVEPGVNGYHQAEDDWQPVEPSPIEDDEQASIDLTMASMSPMVIEMHPEDVPLSIDPATLALIAVERLHLAVVNLDCLQEELALVGRFLGDGALVNDVWADRFAVLVEQVRKAVVDLRHAKSVDAGACGRRQCAIDAAEQHQRAAFPEKVAHVVALHTANDQARHALHWIDVREAAYDYDQAVIAAYNRDPTEEAA